MDNPAPEGTPSAAAAAPSGSPTFAIADAPSGPPTFAAAAAPGAAPKTSRLKNALAFVGAQVQICLPVIAAIIISRGFVHGATKVSHSINQGLGGRPGGYKAGFNFWKFQLWFKSADQCRS